MRLADSIRAALPALADPVRAVGQQRYMRSALPYLGLTMGQVRATVRPLVRADPAVGAAQWAAVVRDLWDHASYREHRYAALVVVRHPVHGRFRTVAAMPLLEHLVVTGAWWDLVDETSSVIGQVRRSDPAPMAEVLRGWAVAGDLWRRRSAIITQVGHRRDLDRDLLLYAVDANLEGAPTAGPHGRQDFFIRKAIGWALRDTAREHPDWVREVVAARRDRMAGLTVREALKHL